MNRFSENSIKNLIQIAKDPELEYWKKCDYFKSTIEILENDQEEFANWVLLFIKNHESWLTKSKYSEELENCFDSNFEECLDKLEESKFHSIISSLGDTIRDEKNLTIPIFLLEAARFGYIKPTPEILEKQTFHQRHINSDIKEAYEILFPDSYQQHIDVRYERMLYCDFDKENEKIESNFGGTIARLVNLGINRIVTINPIPESLNIKSVSKITIAFNFDKAFWIPINTNSPYFIQHDKNGEPINEINTIPKTEIEFYKENPLSECKVILRKVPRKYIHHPNSKNEWRIGGMPNWVQEPQELECPTCKTKMKFIIQLPSGDLKDIKNEVLYYGSDGGTTYGFWCEKDQIMGYIWQDT